MGEAELQIAFFYRLQNIKKVYLKEALRQAISGIDISILNAEAEIFYSNRTISKIASFGLRAEVFLPIPSVLKANPQLLGYYRLLFGISQKEFYSKGVFGKYKSFEEGRKVKGNTEDHFDSLITELVPIATELIAGIDDLSLEIVHELQILTLGPQFRGGRNTVLGKEATDRTFELIRNLVHKYIVDSDQKKIKLVNKLDQIITVQFASDPDIVIVEELENGPNKVVSIEIKGGTDFSNAHNRLGEAEKSHQKAKQDGFFEFWTIVRVDIDPSLAKKESPTTNRFFNLDKIEDTTSSESSEFKQQLASRLKIVL